VEQVIFRVAGALKVPVLIVTLVALALVVIDAGYLAMEVWRRRHRSYDRLDEAVVGARKALASGDRGDALTSRRRGSWSGSLNEAVERLVSGSGDGGGDQRTNKALADFDYRSLKRLERSRFLVRAGPALGLMGTLIPLAPALAALAAGNVAELS